jgi:hypothetical protein
MIAQSLDSVVEVVKASELEALVVMGIAIGLLWGLIIRFMRY